MKSAVRDPVRLCQLLRLPAAYEKGARQAAVRFPVFAPLGYIARMQPGDAYDPLLRQVLPLDQELCEDPRFNDDPVGDATAQLAPGLLQKYHGRALMITGGACAVHCRYCFRRHYPYGQSEFSQRDWKLLVRQIADDRTIKEIVLSGGDPLTRSDGQLAELATMLAEISSLRRLRVHTRLPIVIPERVTDQLLAGLCGTRLLTIMVVHANHPNELDDAVAAALIRVAEAGIQVLNQAVLLRGVNDSPEVLIALSERLLECRVLPYYLHQMDRVTGAAHFEVPVERGRQLVAQIRQRLPGYAVPRYVQEIPGQPAKTVLG